VIRSLDHSSVPADVSHGGEGVKHLGPGDPGHAVHAESSQFSVSQSLDKLWVLPRVKEGVEDTFIPGNKDDISLH
jgi:hypothetical protein